MTGNNNYFDERKVLIDTLFKDRENFTIVALTGYTGTGCSILAETMSREFADWTNLRDPSNFAVTPSQTLDNEELMYERKNNNDAIGRAVFYRKYSLCYNYAENHYRTFRILKYSDALLFYTLKYLVIGIDKNQNDKTKDETKRTKKPGEKLKEDFQKILYNNYRPSKDKKDDDYREKRITSSQQYQDFSEKSEHKGDYKWEEAHIFTGCRYNEWDNLYNTIKDCGDDREKMAEVFFNINKNKSEFKVFLKALKDYLWKLDSYCTNFFFHRLGFIIRATGNPLAIARDVIAKEAPQGKYLYVVVELINDLIKGYKKVLNTTSKPSEEHKAEEYREKPCRIVIDKIRNSLEAKFLKERYSAFYMIATHEEQAVESHLCKRIEKIYEEENKVRANEELTALQIKKIIELDSIEREGKDFENGRFFSQNLSQCVADAEIHISNEAGMGGDKPYFYSMSEQWMKYASLIQHPGLITPSSEERCMVVAYTAKFNSGCISRQVGAVITNKAHSIRTIGWNDVPYGQVPCGLRELPMMANGTEEMLKIRSYLYSEYEIGDKKRFKDGKTFNEKVRVKYRNLHLGVPKESFMDGLPWSYCFKSLQNEFDGEKNQVHTRSLHAEENAMLQMVKYGGESLYQGIIYVTASPCELCCKKLYQIGVRKIVYIDEYPGISRENIISIGYQRPNLKQFQGAYGATYFKLYQPIIPYKEELAIRRGEIIKKEDIKKNVNPSIVEELNKLGVDIFDSNLTWESIKNKINANLKDNVNEESENTTQIKENTE